MSEVDRLTDAQWRYLAAVADRSTETYEPRHGVTANWAIRRGYAQTMIRKPTGEVVPWPDRYFKPGFEILGQTLTEKGLAALAHLQAIQEK